MYLLNSNKITLITEIKHLFNKANNITYKLLCHRSKISLLEKTKGFVEFS